MHNYEIHQKCNYFVFCGVETNFVAVHRISFSAASQISLAWTRLIFKFCASCTLFFHLSALYKSIFDFRNEYWYVKLDEERSYMTTFDTPFGRYRWIRLRLPFGTSTSSEFISATSVPGYWLPKHCRWCSPLWRWWDEGRGHERSWQKLSSISRAMPSGLYSIQPKEDAIETLSSPVHGPSRNW